ncbi:hypothetical protein MPSEU_001083200 [Mayamaea pseudoterrestris]|nr:hypothetical protein MPSEU_001083200 [Mayamaea pseudoterrestris]
MESSYPRGSSNRRSGNPRHAKQRAGGTADRPLAAEDEYIRSLRKRQVEREQQQLNSHAAASASSNSSPPPTSRTSPSSSSNRSIYDDHESTIRSSNRRTSAVNYTGSNLHSSTSSRRNSSSSSWRKEETDSSTEQPPVASSSSSSRRNASSNSNSSHYPRSSHGSSNNNMNASSSSHYPSANATGSSSRGGASSRRQQQVAPASLSASYTAPSASSHLFRDAPYTSASSLASPHYHKSSVNLSGSAGAKEVVLVSGISSSNSHLSSANATSRIELAAAPTSSHQLPMSPPPLPLDPASSTSARVVQVDGHRYSVSSSLSGSSKHIARQKQRSPRRSEKESMNHAAAVATSSSSSPNDVLTRSSQSRKQGGGSSSHSRKVVTDDGVGGADVAAVRRNQAMQSTAEFAQSHSQLPLTAAAAAAAAATSTPVLPTPPQASNNNNSFDVLGGSAADNARALRAQRLRESVVRRNSSSTVMAAVAGLEEVTGKQQSTTDNDSGTNNNQQQLPQQSATPLVTQATIAPSPVSAPLNLPGVNQFLLQRRTTTTSSAVGDLPLPSTMLRSQTVPSTSGRQQQQGNSNTNNATMMSSLLSRDSKSFEFDSDSSSDAAEADQETAASGEGYLSSDDDDDEFTDNMPEYSVRVSIVSAVDLPANVVPNLPLSPVLRVGLVRMMPEQENPQGDYGDDYTSIGVKNRQEQNQKALMTKIVSTGLQSIPNAKVRTTSAKILSKRDNGSVEFHEEMRWDRVRYPDQMVVAIELSSRAVMVPRNIKESPPPPKAQQIPFMMNGTASLGTLQRQAEATADTTARGNLAAFGSLFKRPAKKEKEIETATAAAAVAHMLVEPADGEAPRQPTMRPLNQSELYVKLRPRKPRKKKLKMTEDLHIASQVIPLTKLPLRKALLGMDCARIEQWIELDGSFGACAVTPGAAAPLANKRNPSILVEITFSPTERLDDSEDDMDEDDDMEAQVRASYAKRQSMKIRNQLREESARREAKHQVKKEPELVPGVIDFVCVVGARDIGDQKYDDGSNGWVNSSPECCILERFPPNDDFHLDKGRIATLPDKVEWFCFPDSCRLWRGSTPPNLDELNLQRFSASSPANIATSIASFDACLGCTTSFTWFVLSSNSDEYGSESSKNYGAAIRFFVPSPRGIDPTQDDFAQAIMDPDAADDFDLPGGKRLWVPMAVMITSRLPIIGTMEVMLLRICEALGNIGIPGDCSGLSHVLHKELASLIVSYQRPIPGVVHCSVPFLAGDRFHIALPPPGGLPPLPHGNSVASVCRLLGPDGLNFLLAAFLTECKIVLHSNDMANLCLVSEVMTALIYPFTWTLPYVPVLPTEMIELIEAPLSYLIGVPSCNMKYIDPRQVEDVIFVDLDKDFSSADYQESKDAGAKLKSSTPLPASVASNISKAVYRLLRTEEENEDEDVVVPTERSFPRMEAESAAEREFRVAVAIEICGLLRGFQDCLIYASSAQPIFNIDRFLQIAPALFEEQRGTSAQGSQLLTQVLSPRSRRFMSILVNCQHFHQFLETLESEHTLFFREIMSTVHANSATRRTGRSGQLTLDYQNTQASLCTFLQRLEDKVPTYHVGRVFDDTEYTLDQSQLIDNGSRWPRDLLQRISTVNDSMSVAGSVDQSDGGIKQISVEYLVELEKNPWRYQTLFEIPPEHLAGAPFESAARKVKLKDAIGERRYQAWKLALEQEKFDFDDSSPLSPEPGTKSASANLDLNSLLTSAADDVAPLSANPWEDGFTKSKLVSAQQRLQDAKDRDVLRRCIVHALMNKASKTKDSVAENDMVSESEIALRNESARKFLLNVLSKRTPTSADGANDKRALSSAGASKLENNAFLILLRLGCALLDACIELKDYDSAYAILKLTAGIYTITGDKENVAVSYLTARLGLHPIFGDMGVWERSKDLHVAARRENKAEEAASGAKAEEYNEEEDEYDAAVATLYEMLGYGIPSEELARFAARVNEIHGWHHSERGQSLLMLARRLSVRREHGAVGTSPEKRSDLEFMSSSSGPAVARPALKGELEVQAVDNPAAVKVESAACSIADNSQNLLLNSDAPAIQYDEDFEWVDLGWCHPAAQSRRMNTGASHDIRRPGGTSSLLSMLDETKINADAAKQTTKHMKRSAITSMAYLGASVVVTGGIDGGVFLARKTFPSTESSSVPDGTEKNGVCGVHLDWGSSGSRYTVGSTTNTLDGEYGVGAVTCLATTSGGSLYASKSQSNSKGVFDSVACLDDEDLLEAMEGRRVVAGTTCGDLRVWSVKDVFSSVFYSNHNEMGSSASSSIAQSHASGAASSRVANPARRKSATDFAAGSSLTRLKFSLRGRALSGHRGGVSCIDVPSSIYRPDAIVSGGADGLIKLWNLRSPGAAATRMDQAVAAGTGAGDTLAQQRSKSAPTGDALSILSGHGGRILCLKTAWHGDRLLSGGADRTVRIWDLAGSGGRCLHSLSGHLGWVTQVQFWGPNTIVSASTDRSVALWDARVRGTPLFMLRHHYAPVSDLLVGSRTDPIMISAGSDGSIAAWDFRYLSNDQGAGPGPSKKQQRLCTTVRDPDGRLFLQKYSKHGRGSGSVLLSRGPNRVNRKTILCVGTDSVVREWDYQTGQVVTEHATGHCDLVSSFHSVQGNKLYDSQLSSSARMTGTISTSWDGTVRMRTLVATTAEI